MLEFKELKEDILQRARYKGACVDEYKRAYDAETKEELFQVIVNNITWCLKKDMLNTTYLIANFGDLFERFGIYVTGHHEVENKDVILFGSSSATVKIFGNSSAVVKICDSSSATVETCDSSSATVKTCDSSSATVKTFGNSSAIVETCGNSSTTVETFGSSSAVVKTWSNSSANVKTFGNSSAIYELKGDYSTIKDFTKCKLIVKKSKFKIVEVD